METKYITLTKENIDKEHICCAFSDKKCSEGYEMKKAWLKQEFDNGYVFRRLDARTDCYVNGNLQVLAQERNIPLKIIRLETMQQAQNAPTPATIFSVFYNGRFVTTDMSICTESRFVKMLGL